MPHYIEDEHGAAVPIGNLFDWGRWMATADRQVAHHIVSDGVSVSTVFLGLDHQFGLNGPPMLYETLVFGGPLDGEMERYPTRTLAVIGHAEMVARVRNCEGEHEGN